MIKKSIYLSFLSLAICICFVRCYSTKWNSINTDGNFENAPESVLSIFQKYSDNIMSLEALCPAYDYMYDIGEKDELYGTDSLTFRFNRVDLVLRDQMPTSKVLADLFFKDGRNNVVKVESVDLLKLIPKLEGPAELAEVELLEKEFNRFGYVFRKEHKEFEIEIDPQESKELQSTADRVYRSKISNNCLSPGKWEFELTSEDYSDFRNRLKASHNLNQNKIIAHSWFYLDSELYQALFDIKNPGKQIDLLKPYDDLSNAAEEVIVNFDELRNPLKKKLHTRLIEVGHKTAKKIEPLDVEQFYKKEFGLVLNDSMYNYSSILDTKIKTAQFRDEGFYKENTPKEFDFSWMRHMDSISVEVIDVADSDTYIQLSLSGKWSPYKLVLGNVDLAQVSEQKLLGYLFGVNTYPKGRRYNPVQNTTVYDPDLIPPHIKPYLLLTDTKTGKWINNQYKGIEKVYISYESIERDIIEIYVLSYERILPVWMARVKLPRDFREKVRIKKNLYSNN